MLCVCGGRSAQPSLCTGSSESSQRSAEQAETEIPLPLFQQLVLPDIDNLLRNFNLRVPLKNFLENIFLGLEWSDASPAAKTVIIYG